MVQQDKAILHEMVEAKNYLRNKLRLAFDEELIFAGMTVNRRYRFYRKDDKSIIYVVLSKEERNKLQREDTDTDIAV